MSYAVDLQHAAQRVATEPTLLPSQAFDFTLVFLGVAAPGPDRLRREELRTPAAPCFLR